MKRKLSPKQLRDVRMALTRSTAKYGIGGLEKKRDKPRPITMPKVPERKTD